MVRTRTDVDTCRDCGRPFGPDRPRAARSLRCVACLRAAKQAIHQAYYERHNAYRIGLPFGQANAAEYQTVELADRIAEHRERARIELEQLPRQLQRTCEFCTRLAVDANLLQRQICEIDSEPDDTGGCDRWEPRYRIDGDGE